MADSRKGQFATKSVLGAEKINCGNLIPAPSFLSFVVVMSRLQNFPLGRGTLRLKSQKFGRRQFKICLLRTPSVLFLKRSKVANFFNFYFFLVILLVYNACGLASYHLFDEVDFDQWFVNQLVNELNNSSPRCVFAKSPHSPLESKEWYLSTGYGINPIMG